MAACRKTTRSRGNPFLPAVAGQKFLPPGGCGSLFSRRATAGACEKQTAAPAPLRLFRPQDAPQLRSPWGQNLALNRALAAKRLAHSQRQISLYVSCPSAHVGWTGLFCRRGLCHSSFTFSTINHHISIQNYTKSQDNRWRFCEWTADDFSYIIRPETKKVQQRIKGDPIPLT